MSEEKKVTFSDYLYVLFKWRKFLIINMLIIVLGATLYSFLIPKTYRASAVVMISPDNSFGVGGIASLLGGSKSSGASLGAKLLGNTGSSEDILLGLLNSRAAITNVMTKFNLMEYYEIDDNNTDKLIKRFYEDLAFELTENGFLEISIINKSPQKSAEIANYYVNLLDSLNIKINSEAARNNRIFIEKRYFKNLDDLKIAENSLYKFQKEYGIAVIPEQLELAYKAAGELEAKMYEKEIEAFIVKQQLGEDSPQYQGLFMQAKMFKDKVLELKNADKLSEESNILFPFKGLPDITLKYLRYYRELEIQSKILEVILPMYEQAKVEEQKSIPAVLVIDDAVPPQLKHAPKKAFIILAFLALGVFIFVPLTFRMEKLVNKNEFRNPLEKKESAFYNFISRMYRIHFS